MNDEVVQDCRRLIEFGEALAKIKGPDPLGMWLVDNEKYNEWKTSSAALLERVLPGSAFTSEFRTVGRRADSESAKRGVGILKAALGELKIRPVPPRIANPHAEPDILISWSKPISHAVARALYDWLPKVLPGIHPWLSEEDIDKGTEWFSELQGALTGARACLICVTTENVRSPWIYFEAGVIAARGEGVLICPYLVGTDPAILMDGPLSNRQCTVHDEGDIWIFVRTLNDRLLKSPLDAVDLQHAFRSHWPALAERVASISLPEEGAGAGFVRTEADDLAGVALSMEARALLLEAAHDKRGSAYRYGSLDGASIKSNGHEFCTDQSPRTVARWESALELLIDAGLLKDPTGKGAEYRVTDLGFKIVDLLGEAGSRP